MPGLVPGLLMSPGPCASTSDSTPPLSPALLSPTSPLSRASFCLSGASTCLGSGRSPSCSSCQGVWRQGHVFFTFAASLANHSCSTDV